jgi:hypothetical protein
VVSFASPPSASNALRHGWGNLLRPLLLATVGLCALGTATGRAVASADQYVELRWNAPAGCPDRSAVLRSIDGQLGANFVTDTHIRASAQVIAQDAEHFELHIEYTTDAGTHDERRIRGESCAAAADAAALVLTLALNPSLVEPKPVPTATPAEVPSAPRKDEQPRTATAWSVEALALLDTAVMSKTAFGAGLRVGFQFGPVQLSVAGHYFFPDDVTVAGIDTRLHFWSVDLRACYMAQWSAVALGPCANFEVGRLAGEAHGALDAAQSGAARLQAAKLGGEIRVRLYAPLWLALSAGVEWIARRPQFVVEGVGPVSSSTPFGARIELGPLLTW